MKEGFVRIKPANRLGSTSGSRPPIDGHRAQEQSSDHAIDRGPHWHTYTCASTQQVRAETLISTRQYREVVFSALSADSSRDEEI